jgi:hypothetical protein
MNATLYTIDEIESKFWQTLKCSTDPEERRFCTHDCCDGQNCLNWYKKLIRGYAGSAEAKGQLKFSFEKFKNREIAVRCKSKEDATLFVGYLYGRGISWGHPTWWIAPWDINYLVASDDPTQLCFFPNDDSIPPVVEFDRNDLI